MGKRALRVDAIESVAAAERRDNRCWSWDHERDPERVPGVGFGSRQMPNTPRRPVRKKSLALTHRALSREWHPTKNGRLRPSDVSSGSGYKAWWRCPRDRKHEWQASIGNRARGRGCPCCAGNVVTKDRSFAASHPELAKQWDKKRNGTLTPSDVSSGSGRNVWWKCSRGFDHVWRTTVGARARARGDGCPMCAGQRASLATSLDQRYPHVARFWHPTKNKKLTPMDVLPASHRKVWWRCRRDPDHEWQAPVQRVTRARNVCPYCDLRRPSKTSSLAAKFPRIAKEWHPTKNGARRPEDITPGSHDRVWWRCNRNGKHEWRARIQTRTRTDQGCPECARDRIRDRSIVVLFPRIAREWHPTKNRTGPELVAPGSNQRAWWRCTKDQRHEWATAVQNRTRIGSGCPYCRGMRATADHSLATKFPAVAREWHPTKNGDLAPADVTPRSGRSVWWQCKKDARHVWRARVANRAHPKSTCVFCVGQRVLAQESLAAHYPRLAKELDRVKHGRGPDEISARNTKVLWWRCAKGPDHEWRAKIRVRAAGRGKCPFCEGKRVSVTNCLATVFPEIARDWHPTKNGRATPREVLATLPSPAWWQCRRGHAWREPVRGRSLRKSGCPVCSRRLPERNSSQRC